jgi:hypothetical protein
MSDPTSELVEISKLNGDFKENYGLFLLGPASICALSVRRAADLTFGAVCYSP